MEKTIVFPAFFQAVMAVAYLKFHINPFTAESRFSRSAASADDEYLNSRIAYMVLFVTIFDGKRELLIFPFLVWKNEDGGCVSSKPGEKRH